MLTSSEVGPAILYDYTGTHEHVTLSEWKTRSITLFKNEEMSVLAYDSHRPLACVPHTHAHTHTTYCDTQMAEALVKLNASLAQVRSENSILLGRLHHAEAARQRERAEDRVYYQTQRGEDRAFFQGLLEQVSRTSINPMPQTSCSMSDSASNLEHGPASDVAAQSQPGPLHLPKLPESESSKTDKSPDVSKLASDSSKCALQNSLQITISTTM